MSVLIALVVADESEATAIRDSDVPYEIWPGIPAEGIDHVKLISLHSIIFGVPYQANLLDEFAVLTSEDDDSCWVNRVPLRLVTALATLESARITEVANEWSQIEEFTLSDWPKEEVESILKNLCSLAKQATSTYKCLLMWVCV